MALGTMHFGTQVPTAQALLCLDAAAEVGATFWDTANNYAFWAGGAGDESESLIGSWFAAHGSAARDRITLATKAGAKPRPGYSDLDHVEGLSASALRTQVTDSLRRLRTDRIDLLYTHIDDTTVPLEETTGALADLVEEGIVREVAASNLTAPRLREAVTAADRVRYRALQQRFTFLDADPAVDTFPQVILDEATETVAEAAEIVLVAYSPLLSGAYTRSDRPLPPEYRTARTEDALAVLREVTGEVDLDAGQVVLAWMRQRRRQVTPIVGVSCPEQITAAWTAVHHDLPADAVAALEAARA